MQHLDNNEMVHREVNDVKKTCAASHSMTGWAAECFTSAL